MRAFFENRSQESGVRSQGAAERPKWVAQKNRKGKERRADARRVRRGVGEERRRKEGGTKDKEGEKGGADVRRGESGRGVAGTAGMAGMAGTAGTRGRGWKAASMKK